MDKDKDILKKGKNEVMTKKVDMPHCPVCGQRLDWTDAFNDGASCKCGIWYWASPFPNSTDASAGWHFYPHIKRKKAPTLEELIAKALQERNKEILEKVKELHVLIFRLNISGAGVYPKLEKLIVELKDIIIKTNNE